MKTRAHVPSRPAATGRLLLASVLLAVAAHAAAPVKEYKNIEYKKVGGASLLLDLFVPGGTDGVPPPLVVYIHGGGFQEGSKEKAFAQHLVGKGFAVANINYRLVPAARFPVQVQDCKSAVKFLRANAAKYGYDGAHIGATGESAGGHLVLMLGVTEGVKSLEHADDAYGGAGCGVQAVCNMFGASDFSTSLSFVRKIEAVEAAEPGPAREKAARELMEMPETKCYFAFRGLDPAKVDPAAPDVLKGTKDLGLILVKCARGFLGGPLEDNLEKLTAASPVSYVTGPLKRDPAKFPPFLMMHADGDFIVPATQSTLVDEALRSVGARSAAKIYHMGTHSLPPEHKQDMADFFNRELRPAPR